MGMFLFSSEDFFLAEREGLLQFSSLTKKLKNIFLRFDSSLYTSLCSILSLGSIFARFEKRSILVRLLEDLSIWVDYLLGAQLLSLYLEGWELVYDFGERQKRRLVDYIYPQFSIRLLRMLIVFIFFIKIFINEVEMLIVQVRNKNTFLNRICIEFD